MERIIDITEINRREALRYMGQLDLSCDEKLLGVMDKCEIEMLKALRPKFVYRAFDFEIVEDGVKIHNTSLILPGNDIKKHLDNCKKVVLMAVTLSSDVDRVIRTAQIRDMLEALALDCYASAAVEQCCDKVEEFIKSDFEEYEMTFRYGVGYGDLPLKVQAEFLKVLNASRLIGLNVTESSILTPRKSVTAVIGLSQNPVQPQKKGCEICNLKGRCAYRMKGSYCNV